MSIVARYWWRFLFHQPYRLFKSYLKSHNDYLLIKFVLLRCRICTGVSWVYSEYLKSEILKKLTYKFYIQDFRKMNCYFFVSPLSLFIWSRLPTKCPDDDHAYFNDPLDISVSWRCKMYTCICVCGWVCVCVQILVWPFIVLFKVQAQCGQKRARVRKGDHWYFCLFFLILYSSDGGRFPPNVDSSCLY